VALAAGTAAWWDAGDKTARCEVCGVSGETTAPAPPEPRHGVAGGSAQAMAERKRARREADVRAAHPRLGGLILAVFEEPQDIKNWDKGAEGERTLGAGLDGLADAGVITLHDRRRTGTTANIDHISIAPSGVWVIDAKHYKGKVLKRDVGGWLKVDMRLFVDRRNCTKVVRAMTKQAEAIRKALGDDWAEVPVRPMLCFVDAQWSWPVKAFHLDGVVVAPPKAVRRLLLEPSRIAQAAIEQVAGTLDRRLHPAA
jgi:hypothetical protein